MNDSAATLSIVITKMGPAIRRKHIEMTMPHTSNRVSITNAREKLHWIKQIKVTKIYTSAKNKPPDTCTKIPCEKSTH